MTFAEAIKSGFQNYVGFTGRAARSEFWWWHLFLLLVYFAFIILVLLLSHPPDVPGGLIGIFLLVVLALFLPTLAILIRRLHDLNLSGWWSLLEFIPIVNSVGIIWLLAWCSLRGTVGPNRFGADPLSPPAT
jgi:uncharacterized membrane protein YhaH (DUF805 family)